MRIKFSFFNPLVPVKIVRGKKRRREGLNFLEKLTVLMHIWDR